MFGVALTIAEDVAEDLCALSAAAQYGTQDTAKVEASVIPLQRTEQCFGALRLAGVATQRADEQGKGRGYRVVGLRCREPQLLRDGDGSLSLYVQAQSPGTGKEANWLPAPNGPFYAILRIYQPKPSVQIGTWSAHKLQKAD